MREMLWVLALALGSLAVSGAHAQSGEPTATLPQVERHIVRLESPEPGVAFHLETASRTLHTPFRLGDSTRVARTELREFEALCQAPCEISLKSGVYTFALSRPGGPPVPVFPPVDLDRPRRIVGTYVDNSGVRAAGATTMILGILASGAVVGASTSFLSQAPSDDSTTRDLGHGLLLGGIAAFALTFAIGLGLGLMGDGGRLEF
jgi:hypothetical protein